MSRNLTVDEVCKRLRINPLDVGQLVHTGQLRPVQALEFDPVAVEMLVRAGFDLHPDRGGA